MQRQNQENKLWATEEKAVAPDHTALVRNNLATTGMLSLATRTRIGDFKKAAAVTNVKTQSLFLEQ
jgi:hypothetical protein